MKSKSRSAKEICCEIEALCETACEPESQQALDKYHKGSVHATILISTGFSDRMQTEIRRISASLRPLCGKSIIVSPQSRFAWRIGAQREPCVHSP